MPQIAQPASAEVSGRAPREGCFRDKADCHGAESISAVLPWWFRASGLNERDGKWEFGSGSHSEATSWETRRQDWGQPGRL